MVGSDVKFEGGTFRYRPVVNKTGIDGRYDLDLSFTPDETQFNWTAAEVTGAGGWR